MAKRNTSDFEKLFRELFRPLTAFAFKYIGDVDEAKNIVHDVFINLWEKLPTLADDINQKSYLFTAVRNRSLNVIRDRKKHVILSEATINSQSEQQTVLEANELEREIAAGIGLLPDKCREVFELSRGEGLKYSEIAQRLGISVKTVEAQMTKALSFLRNHLKDFLTIIFLLAQ